MAQYGALVLALPALTRSVPPLLRCHVRHELEAHTLLASAKDAASKTSGLSPTGTASGAVAVLGFKPASRTTTPSEPIVGAV